jgi:hypothetical protein
MLGNGDGNGDDETSEGARLVRLLAKCPSLAKAFDGSQTTFDDEAEPTDDDLAFITRVRGAPLQIWGRLQRNGRWLITSYLVPTAAEHEDATEAIADLTEQKILVPRHERLAEALVRFVDRKLHPQRRSARGLPSGGLRRAGSPSLVISESGQ